MKSKTFFQNADVSCLSNDEMNQVRGSGQVGNGFLIGFWIGKLFSKGDNKEEKGEKKN